MPPIPIPNKKLVEAWQLALEQQVQSGDLSDTMRNTYEWGFAQFMDWLDNQGVEKLTDEMIQDWVVGLHDQGHNSFSISFWISCVQNFFGWADASGQLPGDPSCGIELRVNGRAPRLV